MISRLLLRHPWVRLPQLLGYILFGWLLHSADQGMAQSALETTPQQPVCRTLSTVAFDHQAGNAAVLPELQEWLGNARVTASTRSDRSAPYYELVLGTSRGSLITHDGTRGLCRWELPTQDPNGPSPVQALLLLKDRSVVVASGLELFLVPSDHRPAVLLPYRTPRVGTPEDHAVEPVTPPAYFTSLVQLPSGRILLGAARGLWSMPDPSGGATQEAEECLRLPVNRVRALVLHGEAQVIVGSRSKGLVWLSLKPNAPGRCGDFAVAKSLAGARKDITALTSVPWDNKENGAVAFGTFEGEVGLVSEQSELPAALLPAEEAASPAIVHRLLYDPVTGRLLVARGQLIFAPKLEAAGSAALPEPLATPALGYDHRQVGTFLLLQPTLLLIGAERVPIIGGGELSWYGRMGLLALSLVGLWVVWRYFRSRVGKAKE